MKDTRKIRITIDCDVTLDLDECCFDTADKALAHVKDRGFLIIDDWYLAEDCDIQAEIVE